MARPLAMDAKANADMAPSSAMRMIRLPVIDSEDPLDRHVLSWPSMNCHSIIGMLASTVSHPARDLAVAK